MVVMAKDVIHISDKEAASDFASLLPRVREVTVYLTEPKQFETDVEKVPEIRTT
ncbi:MAG: hypothetical protein WAR24_01660 [Candidatus Acidiferrales bacterium]